MLRRFSQMLRDVVSRRLPVALFLLPAACEKPPPATVEFLPPHKITVVVTTTHLAELARQVGGDAVSVECLATPPPPKPKAARLEDVKDAVLQRTDAPPPEAAEEKPAEPAAPPPPEPEPPWNPNPFLQQLTASDFFEMRTARVVVVNGLGLEKGMAQEIPKLREAGVVAVALGDELPQEEILLNAAGQPDPCIWNSCRLWLLAVDIMANTLKKAVPPEAAPYFENRAHELKQKMARMLEWASERLSATPEGQRFVLASHDSLRYFARDFGMQIRAVFAPDGQPLPVQEAELLSWLDAHGVNDFLADATMPPLVADELCSKLRLVRSSPSHTIMLAKPGSRQLGLVEALDVSTHEGAFRSLIRSVERRMGGGKRIHDGASAPAPPPEAKPAEPAPAENP